MDYGNTGNDYGVVAFSKSFTGITPCQLLYAKNNDKSSSYGLLILIIVENTL